MIDPLTVALPSILTIMLCVKFFVSDSENTRSKLTAFGLLLSFVWILPFLYQNEGLDSFLRKPIHNTFIQAHAFIVWCVVMIAWGIYIYLVSTND
jgi:hypothetical protein